MNYIVNDNDKTLAKYKPREIAKYIRLSLADEKNFVDESESITNQRRILDEFINKNGNTSDGTMEYVDDGVSGTNFDRPGWKKLEESMENGDVKVVITKNLSRLGRSNFECSYYLDYYFPDNKIRYIAIQEQIDTENNENTNNEYAALNNFINEKYSRDLSKNIKRVYKIKQYAGEYMGGTPLYGYIKDPNDKHKLIVDQKAAVVVKKIFNLYLELKSQSAVMKRLTDEKIPIPEVHKKTKRGLLSKFPYEWNYHTVRTILRNRMYIGDMVQNVHNKKSFREKKIVKTNKDEWIIVKNTHEPIIQKDIFDRVQNLLNCTYRQVTTNNDKILKGIMLCGECGHKIGIGKRSKSSNDSRSYVYTYCNFYRKNSSYNKCTPHSINYFVLEEKILNKVFDHFNDALKNVDFNRIINKKKSELSLNKETITSKIDKLRIDIKTIELKMEKLYVDRLNDIITSTMYKKMSSDFQEEIALLKNEIKKLKLYNEKYENEHEYENIFNHNEIINEFIKDIKMNPRELIIKMIEKIKVFQDKRIEIYFSFKI